MSLPTLKYRPDIDGLRAVAVLLVLNFHAFPDAMPGGFVGVDVFFVISGFLITGIIARELELGRFSLVGFYNRRVRRIFPALIVVLCATLALGWLWMLPSAFAQLGSDAFASAAFAANIGLLLQSGYFDAEAARKPLLHLWSLGIEEQFYLIWPLLLMLAVRLRSSLIAVAVVLGLASFVLNIALIGPKPVATFYLPFTRAFELLAGAALACGWMDVSHSSAPSNRRAWAGVLLIVMAAATLDSRSAFPGWWALLPVAGSALLLSSPAAWVNRVVLASAPMIWIGLISYPLYLWHWPLLVFGAMIKFNPLTVLERELILLLSALLAWATCRFVERPFRFGMPNRRTALGLGAGMAMIAIAGGAVVWGRGFDWRLPPEIRAMASVATESSRWRFHECLLDSSHETIFADGCIERDRRPLVLLWGDSTAGALLPGLRKAQEQRGFAIAQLTTSSCIPALNADVAGVPNCRTMNDKVLSLARKIRPDVVLLHGSWERHLDNVAQTVTELKNETDARVVVLGSVPLWRRGLPSEVLRHYMLHRELIPQRSTGGKSAAPYDAVLRARLEPLGAEFISASDILCDAQGCLTRLGDAASDLTASDQVHLTDAGSIYLVGSIIDRVLGEKPANRGR